jgi:hypothetical protein
MITAHGLRQMSREDGMLRQVHFPSLGLMDTPTGDGRLLKSSGQGVRDLPRTIFGQFCNAGHEQACIIGRLDQVIFHDDGNIEGWGWLTDDENGQLAARHLATNDDDFKMEITFTKWNIAATTLVGKPAFRDAHAELIDDELTASLLASDEPLEAPTEWCVADTVEVPELTASPSTTVPFDDFYIPESDTPHKIIVDAQGRVYGHLAEWGKPHRSFTDRMVYPPRPRDGYASFNHPGPLTERGQVNTGPIFLVGGHAKRKLRGLTREQIEDAMGGVENAWCDVRIVEGRHGPWVSGRIRPGLSDEQIYTARCSHVSGHWVGDELVCIPSVNVNAFPVGGYAELGEDNEVLELVASFRPTEKPSQASDIADEVVTKLQGLGWLPSAFVAPPTTVNTSIGSLSFNPSLDTTPTDEDLGVDVERLRAEFALDYD